MNCVMPRPSEVVNTFRSLYSLNPKDATDYFYKLSMDSNYIRKSRIDKNISFADFCKYGDIQITINLSKPRKRIQRKLLGKKCRKYFISCMFIYVKKTLVLPET